MYDQKAPEVAENSEDTRYSTSTVNKPKRNMQQLKESDEAGEKKSCGETCTIFWSINYLI